MRNTRTRPKLVVPKSNTLSLQQTQNINSTSNKFNPQKSNHESLRETTQNTSLHKKSILTTQQPFDFHKKTHIQKTEGSASEPVFKINTDKSTTSRLLFATETKQVSKSLVDLDEQYEIIRTFRAIPMQTIKEIYDNDKKEIERLCSAEKKIPVDSRLAPIRPQLQFPNVPEFRKYFKENERYQELQQFYHLDPNIYQKMTEKIKQEKLMPREMKLFTNNNEKLIANNLLGSDMYVDLFSEGLSSNHFNNLKTLQMKNNRLNNNRITMIAKNLPSSLLDLDFSNNTIGNDGISSICDFLSSKKCYLQILNLEDNKLRDGPVITILKTLQQSKTIKVIKLSKNQITDLSMESFGILLKTSNSLQEVYLHYNQIRNHGGVIFFKSLLRNQYLKVLDFSFNKLGQHKECIAMISEVLGKPHPELTHLDLSYNNFNNDDSKTFHQAVMFNQIIYGFHFEGNSDYTTNTRGFLVNQKELDTEYALLVQKQTIRLSTQQFVDQSFNKIDLKNKMNKLDQNFQLADPSLFKRIQSVDFTNTKSKDNCWLCEGWPEVRFQYIVGKSGSINEYPIYLHLDFENYRPMVMDQDNQIFSLLRMVPPNRKVKYFFSNPFLDIQFTAKDQRIMALEDYEPIKIQGIPMIYADTTVVYSQKISIVNYMAVGQNKKVLDSQKHYIPTVLSKPREQEKIIYIDPNKAKEKGWSIENSIFKDFTADTEGHLLDCFDFDFECGRLQKHIPDTEDLEVLKTKVKTFYKNILACYKFYCAETLNYDMPCVNQQSFIDFISQTNILQKSILNNIDLQLTYLSSYVVQKSAEFVNILDKCLVRYQFLEIIIRLAKEQYLRTNQCSNITEALEALFQQDKVLDLIQEFGVPQDWRDNRYWTQLMDATVKMKMQVLQLIYDYVWKITFKHKKYITLIDFKLFINQLDLGKYVTEKELYLIYLQSMQTQRDELRESRHMQMEFLEFVEALARLAEKISPISPMYAVRNPKVNRVTRKSLPLFVKFEGLLYVIFQKLRSSLTTKTNDTLLSDLERDVISKTILKTVQAKKLGVFEEERSSDEEREKEAKNVPLLPDERDEQELKDKKKTGSGWSKLRNWANKKKLQKQGNLEQINMLKQLQTYQDEEEIYVQHEYENATIYEKMEIKMRQKMKQEFQRTKLQQDPTFKFEEEDEIKRF